MQEKIIFTNKKRVHLIGIGGIGMSGIAQIILASGIQVSGSDLKPSRITEKLRALGARVFIGHTSSSTQNADLVIYSAAIREDNPELVAARACGIPVLTRAQVLAALANEKKSIAVTGAHGKTTTASLISHMLLRCGHKPTICVGGELFSLDGNALLGEDDYFVLEADESDGSFLDLYPSYSIITNIDREHLDYYRDLTHIVETFRQFVDNTKDDGCVYFCYDDPELLKIAHSLNKRFFSFGFNPKADIFAKDVKMQGNFNRFSCIYQGKSIGEINLKVCGRHNISNTLATIAVGLEIGLDFDSIQDSLSSYSGVRRRLELKLREKDILIFDDYAHHPTEIKATLEALKSFNHRRILAIFQPHRYTRTKFLIDDFGSCFRGVDSLIVTDIYPASEPPIPGVSAENICQKAKTAKIKDVRFLPKDNIPDYLVKIIQPGDLIAVMGAGDITKICDELVERIKNSSAF